MKGRKNKRDMFIGLCAAVVLAAVIAGGVVWAQDGASQDGNTQEADSQQDTVRQSKASRVAKILGLGEAEVQDAFKQAHRDLRDERFQNRMDRLVEKGQITEDEAGQAVDWYQSRPENIGHGHRGSRVKGRGHHRPGSRFGGFGMRGGFGHGGS